MFFLIRCVFWLSVVFSTIFSPDYREPVAPGQAQAQALPSAEPRIGVLAQSWIGAAVSLIEREAVAHCVKTDCLKPADTAAGHFLAVAPAQRVSVPAQAYASVPLPPRRPAFASQNVRRSGLEKSSRAEYVIEHSRRS
jgi:hypothetical protein